MRLRVYNSILHSCGHQYSVHPAVCMHVRLFYLLSF